MLKRFLVILGFLGACMGFARIQSHHLVHVFVRDAHDLERALKLDLDLVSEYAIELPARALEVVATNEDIRRIQKAGFKYEIKIKNLEDFYEKRLGLFGKEGPSPPFGKGSMGGYHTFAEVVKIMDDLHRGFPKIVSAKWSIGKSHEGRDIWVQKISDNVNIDENEPEVHYDALIHAREPMSMECTLALMYWLAENYGKDDLATYLVNEREMFFIPVLNPDGYEYNRRTRPNGGGMWRKNRRNNGNGVYGVDLNRNFPYKWGGSGSSGNPRSEIYRGPSPSSEPEIKALLNYFNSRKFVIGFNSHTYSNLLLRPWAWTRGDPPNAKNYDMISKLATRVNHFPYGACGKILYVAAGSAFDTYHQNYGMYGFTPEIGSRSDGFWPRISRVVPLINQNMWMFQAMALVGGPAVTARIAALKEIGGNNNGSFEPGETVGVEIKASNAGAKGTWKNVVASITKVTPNVQVINRKHDFGKVPAFSSRTNSGHLLSFKLPSNANGVYVCEISVTNVMEGAKLSFRIAVGKFRLLVKDDAERDLGWTLGLQGDTATTGRWTRMPPQRTSYWGTVIQPGSDTTPSPGVNCFVTDGRAGYYAGAYDVDNGFTTLLSPSMDLSHAGFLRFKYQRWFMDYSKSDVFRIYVSQNNGASWKYLEQVGSYQSKWTLSEKELPPGVNVTSSMRLKFVAEDADPQSLVEAAVDDLEIWGVTSGPAVTLLSSGARGKYVRIGRSWDRGFTGILLLSTGPASITVPGVSGKLLIDPRNITVLDTRVYGSSGYLQNDFFIPNDPAFAGAKVYFQELVFKSSGSHITAAFSNRQALSVK